MFNSEFKKKKTHSLFLSVFSDSQVVVAVLVALCAAEESRKTKRGILGLGGAHFDVAHGHSHGHGLELNSLGGLGLSHHGGSVNSEIHAAQDHINAAQLGGLGSYGSQGQLGLAQSHLNAAQYGNGAGYLGSSGLLGGIGLAAPAPIAYAAAPAPIAYAAAPVAVTQQIVRTVGVPVERLVHVPVDRPGIYYSTGFISSRFKYY